MEIGGNKFILWLGNKISNIGKRLVNRGKKIVISNSEARLINPFTLMTTFTIEGDKYQLITQGEYKEKYKEHSTEPLPLTESEMEVVIVSNRDNWFLKK